jgi:hypothetical protein
MKKIIFFLSCVFFISTFCMNFDEDQQIDQSLSLELLQEKAQQLLQKNAPLEELKFHAYHIAAFLVSQSFYKSSGIIYTRALCALTPVDKIMNLLLLEKQTKIPLLFVQLIEKLLMLQDPAYDQNRVFAINKLSRIIIALRN